MILLKLNLLLFRTYNNCCCWRVNTKHFVFFSCVLQDWPETAGRADDRHPRQRSRQPGWYDPAIQLVCSSSRPVALPLRKWRAEQSWARMRSRRRQPLCDANPELFLTVQLILSSRFMLFWPLWWTLERVREVLISRDRSNGTKNGEEKRVEATFLKKSYWISNSRDLPESFVIFFVLHILRITFNEILLPSGS